MSRQAVRKQVYIRHDQDEVLATIAGETGMTYAEVLRRVIDLGLVDKRVVVTLRHESTQQGETNGSLDA